MTNRLMLRHIELEHSMKVHQAIVARSARDMMLLGFGVIGFGLRAKRKSKVMAEVTLPEYDCKLGSRKPSLRVRAGGFSVSSDIRFDHHRILAHERPSVGWCARADAHQLE